MWEEFRTRRDAAADRHDAVRAQFAGSDFSSVAFRNALSPIVDELQAVAVGMRDDDGAPPAEIARSWMWYADALFDLAQGGHVPFEEAVAAYGEADPYLRVARDRVLSAKRDGNLANILFRMPPSRTRLRDIIERYQRAIGVLGTGITAGYQDGLARAVPMLEQMDTMAREIAARRQDARQAVSTIANTPGFVPAAAAEMTSLLERLANLPDAETFDEGMTTLQEVQRIMPRLMALASEPRVPESPTRAHAIARLAMQLWQDVATESLAPLDADLRTNMFDVTRELLECAQALRNADPAGALEIERLRLRETAARARRLLAHAHVTWIEPRWETPLSLPTTSSAHVTGATASNAATIASACRARSLLTTDVEAGPDYARRRFESLRSAAVVIADLSGDLASACYELGIALVLGKPLVVLAGRDGVPFDIDVDPVPSDDAAALGDAIDRALVLQQRVPATGSLDRLAAAARNRFPEQRYLADSMDAHIAEPLAVASALFSVLQQKRRETASTALVAYPTWRRHYPDPAPRLFHIMPFRPSWSAEAKRAVRRASESAGAQYRRHDDVADPQILRSLWEELTRATHFVVDLTDMNPNVAVELGIVDALGMPALLIGQPGTVGRLFPMIRRVRITEYADFSELEQACARWLQASMLDASSAGASTHV